MIELDGTLKWRLYITDQEFSFAIP